MKSLSAERLRAVLFYAPETGVFTWRVRLGRNTPAGRVAGGIHKDGRIRISIDKQLYRASRLAWLYMKSEWPPLEVDHRDRDKTNNRWKNLRAATRQQNCFNRSGRANGLPKGISLRGKRKPRWMARIQAGRKQHYLGLFDTADQAKAAYNVAALRLHGDFASLA